jgi:threonine synthase
MQGRLGSLGLGYASFETAAATPGLHALVASGLVSRDESVVLFDTGAGFKSELGAISRTFVDP